MSDMGYTKNVGMIGSISLLVCSITGPGMVMIPLVFQQSGWVIPIAVFFTVGLLCGLASLFVVEAVSRFPGNEGFSRNVEFTVMVHQFYGRKVYYLFLAILYGSLQSTNLASIIGSAQIFDSIFVGIFGGTCGYGIYPISGLYCVTSVTNQNSPFGDNYMLATFGYLVVAAIIIPMTNIDLNDNMFVQLVSFLYNLLFVVTLLGSAMTKGIMGDRVPTIGDNHSQVIGQVLFNFTLANTIPSWLNVKHERVDPKRAVWYSVGLSLFMYIVMGYVGGLAYTITADTNLLQAMFADSSLSSVGKVWITFMYVVFPVLTYITSIPVAMIVVRLNFMAARLLSLEAANFWSVSAPFLIGIPFQTGSWITIIGTYTSLSFQSMCNFFAPFLIYVFLSRRNMEMAQSVLDELEFLDISAGVKKSGGEEDDGFDYIYHLPSAPLDRILYRDPFKKSRMPEKTSSISALSQASRHSIKEIRGMLNPHQKTAKYRKRTVDRSNVGSNVGSQNSSQFMHPFDQQSNHSLISVQKDGLRRGMGIKQEISQKELDIGEDYLELIGVDVATFRAMPDWVYNYINPNSVAIFGFLVMVGMVLQVIVSNVTAQ